jgi:hypothetical protein
MATGSLDANGVWIYGEDDSETTFSALLNKLGDSTSDRIAFAPLNFATANFSTQTTTTSTSYVTTGLQVSITPKKSNSRFIIQAGTSMAITTGNAMFATIYRDGLNIGPTNGTIVNSFETAPFTQIVDSPATLSTITYSLRFRVTGGTGFAQNASSKGTITVWELPA